MPAVIRLLARFWPVILLLLGICSFGLLYTPQPPRPITHNGVHDTFPARKPNRKQLFDGNWVYERDRDNLMLTQEQCTQAFPDLYSEIVRARDDRKSRLISIKELDNIPARNGYIRAMIYDQQVNNTNAISYSLRCMKIITKTDLSYMSSTNKALSGPVKKRPCQL